jgi:hypothetical protein
MDTEALRDHAERILEAVAKDMQTSQSGAEQQRKSRGEASPHEGDDTAAESHGACRVADGFSINEMYLEYRALRASVLRLWAESGSAGPNALNEVTRFNESIDQALGASLDVARQGLEGGIPLDRRPVDVAALHHRAVDESEAFHAAHILKCDVNGDLSAAWDEV